MSDNESTVYIATEPEDSRCELHGQDFTRVVTTPDSIVLPADAAPITVACKSEGYRETTSELDTSADGWMVGNVVFGLLGGPIGLAIDAARGAGMEYPPNIRIVLEPSSFESIEARDRWYDDRRRILEEKWDKVISELDKCRLAADVCEERTEKANKARGKELNELEQRRTTAMITS